MAEAATDTNTGVWGVRPHRHGYLNYVLASFGQMLLMILRQNRLILVSIITFLPVTIPLAIAFLSKSAFADEGNVIFVKLMEEAHCNTLAPLLALFFASMLVGEDVEMQTLPYVLTRPQPRSAWVIGRFLAYILVAGTILTTSIALCFVACTALSGLHLNNWDDIQLALNYAGVAFLGLVAYGSLSAFLGAYTKRPIVYGVLLLYGWQKFALIIPGLIDFLTIQKYTDALLPKLAISTSRREIQTALGTYSKEFFDVSYRSAILTLAGITVVLIVLCIYAVRKREYAATRAAGG